MNKANPKQTQQQAPLLISFLKNNFNKGCSYQKALDIISLCKGFKNYNTETGIAQKETELKPYYAKANVGTKETPVWSTIELGCFNSYVDGRDSMFQLVNNINESLEWSLFCEDVDQGFVLKSQPESKGYSLTVNCTGHTIDDINLALSMVMDKVAYEILLGSDQNETGSYFFEMFGDEYSFETLFDKGFLIDSSGESAIFDSDSIVELCVSNIEDEDSLTSDDLMRVINDTDVPIKTFAALGRGIELDKENDLHHLWVIPYDEGTFKSYKADESEILTAFAGGEHPKAKLYREVKYLEV